MLRAARSAVECDDYQGRGVGTEIGEEWLGDYWVNLKVVARCDPRDAMAKISSKGARPQKAAAEETLTILN